MRAHLKELDAKKPVVYVGDLNVAHRDEDIWNVTASHIKKSAGTTPQEREAFGVMLEENKLVDAFRFFHEGATGWFSYWSVRAGNRPFNKGLRLDYTLASRRRRRRGLTTVPSASSSSRRAFGVSFSLARLRLARTGARALGRASSTRSRTP